ncbi:response regulator [Marinobacter hydrocarbonoclasticus]|nr:response regulator [Marinobacter nauticus]
MTDGPTNPREALEERCRSLSDQRDQLVHRCQENDAVGNIMLAIAKASTLPDVVVMLRQKLGSLLGASDAILLQQKGLTWRKIGSSRCVTGVALFERATSGRVLSVFDPSAVPGLESLSSDTMGSALVLGDCAGTPWVLVLTHNSAHHFDRRAVALMERLQPFLARSLEALAGREDLAQQVAERTLQLSHSEQRFRDFAECASDWFWETDPDHRYRFVSEPTSGSDTLERPIEFLGRTRLELRSVRECANQEKWLAYQRLIDARRPLREFEYEVETDDGQRLWVCLNGIPYFDSAGQFLGYRGTSRNVTQQKRHTAELNRAKEVAEQASQAKSDFLAVMSHEIRTPMGSLLGMLELIKDTDLSVQQQQWLHYAANSAELLQAIINDVLDLSKIESGQLVLDAQPFDLNFLLMSTANQVRAQAELKGLALRCELDDALQCRLVGDKVRLSQVLLNLLANAVKFTPAGEVRMRAMSVPAPPTMRAFQVTIEDTGIGIPSDRLPDLFEPFCQVDSSTTREFGGTGLGLSICKRLVTQMGGTIEVASTLGQGSRFNLQLMLPVAEQERTAIPTQPDATTPVGCRVLVAEDTRANQVVLEGMLKALGYSVALVNDGQAAIERCRSDDFDVIFMDMRMPRADGIAASRTIRTEQGPNQSTPIIAVTANATPDDKRRCFDAGMDAFVSKPFQRREIIEKLEQLQITAH